LRPIWLDDGNVKMMMLDEYLTEVNVLWLKPPTLILLPDL
jgi:hypothetical protein